MGFEGLRKLKRLPRESLGYLLGVLVIAVTFAGAPAAGGMSMSDVPAETQAVALGDLKPGGLLEAFGDGFPESEENEEEENGFQVSADEVLEHEGELTIPYVLLKETLHVVETRLEGFYRPEPLPPPQSA